MTIQLEVEPEVLEAARKEAQALGSTEKDLLRSILREHFLPVKKQHPSASPDDADAVLAEMHAIMKGAPVLPANAFSRQSFYEEE